jgi:hypothetical protein
VASGGSGEAVGDEGGEEGAEAVSGGGVLGKGVDEGSGAEGWGVGGVVVSESLHEATAPVAVGVCECSLGADGFGGFTGCEAGTGGAEVGDDALIAVGTGGADAAAVVHEGGVPAVCGTGAEEELGEGVDGGAGSIGGGLEVAADEASDDANDVGVDGGHVVTEAKAGDDGGSEGTDAREGEEGVGVAGELAMVLLDADAGGLVEIDGASGVAGAVPDTEDFGAGG